MNPTVIPLKKKKDKVYDFLKMCVYNPIGSRAIVYFNKQSPQYVSFRFGYSAMQYYYHGIGTNILLG